MRKILLDTNVILDVLLNRHPHVLASSAVWLAVESGACRGLLAAHTITTTHYLIRRQMGAARTRETMSALLRVFGVAAVDEAVVREALHLSFADFEDAVAAATAQAAGCDLIVTRDLKGFSGSPVRALNPEAAAAIFSRK